MKLAFLIANVSLILGAGASAFATPEIPQPTEICRESLTHALQLEFNDKAWSFYSLKAISQNEVESKLSLYQGNSLELKQADRDKIASFSNQPNLEYYLLNGTTNFAVSFMDLVIVETSSCAILQRNTVYFE